MHTAAHAARLSPEKPQAGAPHLIFTQEAAKARCRSSPQACWDISVFSSNAVFVSFFDRVGFAEANRGPCGPIFGTAHCSACYLEAGQQLACSAAVGF